MNETVKRLLEGNQKYAASGSFAGDFSADRRAKNASGQQPYAAVITCSDSRVVPEAIFSAGLGELFVIRTAGNVVGVSELASLEYAAAHLHIRTVVVLGHTGCGAVHAALCGELDGAVGAVTGRIRRAADGETDPRRVCALNVRDGVETVRAAVGGEDVEVVGGIYDIVSGRVELLD